MPHPFTDTAILTEIHANRFHRDAAALHGVANLPDSTEVRREVVAMLHELAADPPPMPPQAPPLSDRLWSWIPQWVGWLRAMPLP